ncbi:hypothetical protein [Nocardia sp. NPDC020380]|uniref:hypothetical protein n=1 Tax=Nocardia sp. NPDC020380 TaxID=3364309 RepID=UPI0037B3CA15
MTPWSTNPEESAAIATLSAYIATLSESLHAIPEARYTNPSGGFTIPPQNPTLSTTFDMTADARDAA